jgi:hypothetical protein
MLNAHQMSCEQKLDRVCEHIEVSRQGYAIEQDSVQNYGIHACSVDFPGCHVRATSETAVLRELCAEGQEGH